MFRCPDVVPRGSQHRLSLQSAHVDERYVSEPVTQRALSWLGYLPEKVCTMCPPT